MDAVVEDQGLVGAEFDIQPRDPDTVGPGDGADHGIDVQQMRDGLVAVAVEGGQGGQDGRGAVRPGDVDDGLVRGPHLVDRVLLGDVVGDDEDQNMAGGIELQQFLEASGHVGDGGPAAGVHGHGGIQAVLKQLGPGLAVVHADALGQAVADREAVGGLEDDGFFLSAVIGIRVRGVGVGHGGTAAAAGIAAGGDRQQAGQQQDQEGRKWVGGFHVLVWRHHPMEGGIRSSRKNGEAGEWELAKGRGGRALCRFGQKEISMGMTGGIWAVVVGYNHVDDTRECLQSLVDGGFPEGRIVFVDNASQDDSAAIVHREFPAAVVIQMAENTGFARGYNTGMAHAMAQGADFVFILNNDTVADAHTVERLAADARAHPEAGILAPKIFYYDHKDTVWSAGSRYRRFPPAVVLRRTTGPDDGRFDHEPELEFITTCALLFPRAFLEKCGLLDGNFFILHDDYDISIRARQAGFSIRLVPEAHLWHKVSKSTQVGAPNPFVWRHAGRSEAIFRRRHQAAYPWLTGWIHLGYVMLRMVAEGKSYGIKPFIAGFREGQKAELKPVPRWTDSDLDKGIVL